MALRLNKAHFPVTALGPGRRVGIWVQGCSIRCAGCLSLDTWALDEASALPVEKLIEWIGTLPADDIDGFTISGGEPFDQPDDLRDLLLALRAWRQERGIEADLLCYSGYPLAQLEARHGATLDLLDALIPEPFDVTRPTDLVWRGSENQPLVMLSTLGRRRYSAHVESRREKPSIQVSVGEDDVWLIGVPRVGDLHRIERTLADQGVVLEEVSWRP